MDFSNVESNDFPRNSGINTGGKLSTMTTPMVMGILNSTPDSFFAGSRFSLTDNYLTKAEAMIRDGASILDIGGYSSRPGAQPVSLTEERERVVPVIAELRKHFPDILISVDTFRAEIARDAVENGADIVNDISGGSLDEMMFETIAQLGCPYILMHMRGTPQTMQQQTDYPDGIFREMSRYFSERIARLRALGVKDIILDPGFGFAKTTEQNYALLNRLTDFHVFGCPLLVGVSRKTMIREALDVSAEDALNGTTVLNTIALLKGASILRVHDVKEAVEAVRLIAL